MKKSFNTDGVRLHIDNLVFFDGLLYIRGWALDHGKPVKSISVVAKEAVEEGDQAGRDLFVAGARTGEPRDDVAKVFHLEGDGKYAGFEAAVEGIMSDRIALTFRVVCEAGTVEFQAGSKEHNRTSESGDVSGVLILTEKAPASAVRRYRAEHLAEALIKKGIRSRVVNIEYGYEPDPFDYKHLVLQRTVSPCYQYIADRFRKRGGKVLYEIDDALFSYDISIFNEHLRKYPYARKEEVEQIAAIVRRCDGMIVSTDYLAEAARLEFKGKPVYVNRNAANDRMIELSEAARQERTESPGIGSLEDILKMIRDALVKVKNAVKNALDAQQEDEASEEKPLADGKANIKRKDEIVTLAYFSGSSTHDRDFGIIAGVLADILEKHKNVRLMLAGKVSLPVVLDEWKERVDRFDPVDWTKLPALIAKADINLAPLSDTRFNKSKSAIKWLEAALVGVPTAAVRNDEFSRVVRDQETGLLCESDEEWSAAITSLIEDADLRNRIGEAARQDVLEHYTTDQISEELVKFFKED